MKFYENFDPKNVEESCFKCEKDNIRFPICYKSYSDLFERVDAFYSDTLEKILIVTNIVFIEHALSFVTPYLRSDDENNNVEYFKVIADYHCLLDPLSHLKQHIDSFLSVSIEQEEQYCRIFDKLKILRERSNFPQENGFTNLIYWLNNLKIQISDVEMEINEIKEKEEMQETLGFFSNGTIFAKLGITSSKVNCCIVGKLLGRINEKLYNIPEHVA